MADFISELPQEVIHKILSHLPFKDAVITTVLSTKFRSFFLSFHLIELDRRNHYKTQLDDDATNIRNFITYLHRFINRRAPGCALTKFKLCFPLRLPTSHVDLDCVINYAVHNSALELDLDVFALQPGGFDFNWIFYYPLSPRVLSLQSVEKLRLRGFRSPHHNFCLAIPSLKTLSIEDCIGMDAIQISCQSLTTMHISRCIGLKKIELVTPNLQDFSFVKCMRINLIQIELFQDSLSACKSLNSLSLTHVDIPYEDLIRELALYQVEVLNLNDCTLSANLCLYSNKLKKLRLEDCVQMREIKVVAHLLESLCINSVVSDINPYGINIEACISLKSITLESALITDAWIEKNISDHQLASVETLEIIGYSTLDRFRIHHSKLKTVTLRCRDLWGLEEVGIFARQLEEFLLEVHHMPVEFSTDSPKAHFWLSLDSYIDPNDRLNSTVSWFLSLRKSLSKCHCRELEVECFLPKDLIIPEDVKEILLKQSLPPPSSSEIGTTTVYIPDRDEDLTSRHPDLMDSLRWLMPHVDSLTVVHCGSEESFVFQLNPQIQDHDMDMDMGLGFAQDIQMEDAFHI